MTNKFQQRREETHRELIRLGIERFPVKGYSATTIQDVVAGTGLTRGAYYYHFASKEEFFLSLLRARATLRGAWWQIARDPSLGTVEDVLVAVFTHFAQVEEHGAKWILLVADFRQATGEQYGEQLRDLHGQWVTELTNLIIELAARDLVRRDRNPQELATTLLAMVEGFQIHDALYGVTSIPVVDVVAQLLRG